MNFDNFFLIKQDRIKGPNGKIKKGGGVLVYVRKDLEPYVNVMEPSINTPNSEEIWLEMYKPGMKRTHIGIVYRPPNGNLATFTKTLEGNLLSKLDRGNPQNMELYILGDLNKDYTRGADQNKPKMKDLEIKYSMRQLIVQPTRITLHCKSTIDLVYTTIANDLIIDSGVLDVHISDHLLVFVIKKKRRERHIKRDIYVRKAALYSYDIFSNVILDDARWKTFWEPTLTVDELWELLITIIRDSLNKICPFKRISIREKQHDWYDGEINKAVHKKIK